MDPPSEEGTVVSTALLFGTALVLVFLVLWQLAKSALTIEADAHHAEELARQNLQRQQERERRARQNSGDDDRVLGTPPEAERAVVFPKGLPWRFHFPSSPDCAAATNKDASAMSPACETVMVYGMGRASLTSYQGRLGLAACLRSDVSSLEKARLAQPDMIVVEENRDAKAGETAWRPPPAWDRSQPLTLCLEIIETPEAARQDEGAEVPPFDFERLAVELSISAEQGLRPSASFARRSDGQVLRLVSAFTDMREDGACCVCLSAPAAVLFEPCAHLACCVDCASVLKACPICTSPIKRRLEIESLGV
jgi:hypothetical protein